MSQINIAIQITEFYLSLMDMVSREDAQSVCLVDTCSDLAELYPAFPLFIFFPPHRLGFRRIEKYRNKWSLNVALKKAKPPKNLKVRPTSSNRTSPLISLGM